MLPPSRSCPLTLFIYPLTNRPTPQAIGLLDDLDKELNTYAMRVREWYGWHFPEMTKIVADNIAYAKTGALRWGAALACRVRRLLLLVSG